MTQGSNSRVFTLKKVITKGNSFIKDIQEELLKGEK